MNESPEESDAAKQRERELKTGIIGSIIAVICCFTPALVIVLSALGFAALVGYLDYVLFPALAVFLGLTVYGWWMKPPCAGGSEKSRT